MLSAIAAVLRTATSPKARVRLTHGELYRLLSAEFREARGDRCCFSAMPMVFERWTDEPSECNWAVEPLRSGCRHCAPIVDRLAKKYAQVYDLRILQQPRASQDSQPELEPDRMPYCF